MARAVGADGAVVAVNPPQFVSSEQSQAKWASIKARQSNVTMVAAQLEAYEPEANSIDFAMLHLIYHDFYWESEQFKFERMDPAVALANLYAGMKPGGIVAVVDDGDVAGAGAGADGFEVNRCSERSALDRESEMEKAEKKLRLSFLPDCMTCEDVSFSLREME